MNTLKAVDITYLRPDKTIETILVSNSTSEKTFWIYNYQGWFFRVFENLIDLIKFFDNAFEPKVFFEDEKELDQYLETVQF
jgi:hypothetical protein